MCVFILQGCSDRRVAPGIRRTRAAAAGASSWGTSATPTPATRRAHRTGPGTGHAALPGRCRPWATRTEVCGPPPAVPAPPTSARAGDWQCRLARTVQDAGDSDWSPRRAGANGPPPSPARAGDWHCRPAWSVQDAGDSDRGRRPRALCLQRRVGDRPSSPARAGGWHCRPARPVQDAGDSDRGRRLRARRPHQSGPGPGIATPPGRCSGQWLAFRRQTRTRSGEAGPHGRHLTPTANRRQPCSPSVDGLARQLRREAVDV